MLPWDCELTLSKLLRGFPILTLTGPRQSGKTTLTGAAVRPTLVYGGDEDYRHQETRVVSWGRVETAIDT